MSRFQVFGWATFTVAPQALFGASVLACLLSVLSRPACAATEDRWIKVAAPEFTIITTLSEPQAVAWAANFSQFIAALQSFIPINVTRLPRLTLVVFARERDFKRFQPLRENGTRTEVSGYFSRRASWAVAGLAGTSMSPETRSIIFHEGTHWFLSGFELPNPVWLEEGLAEVFSTFGIEGKNVTFGRPIESHVEALRSLPNLPLEQLLFLPQDSLHAAGDEGSLRTGLAYAQSWAFVHYLIFGQRQVPKGSLLDYLKRLRSMHPDEAFQTAFGSSYAAVEGQLRNYLRSGLYYVAKLPLATVPSIKAGPASTAEVEDALARLYFVTGRFVEAKGSVNRALAASPEDPRVYELQGELAQESGESDLARVAYQKAIEKGSKDFRPYFETALALHSEVANTDRAAELTPAQAHTIANLHKHAINLHPTFLPAYQNLAGVVGSGPSGNQEDQKFLASGLRFFPKDGVIRIGLAVIARREGDLERARAMLNEILADATDQPQAMAYARHLDASWLNSDISAQVQTLTSAKKFAEAVAIIDSHLQTSFPVESRLRWKVRRDELQAAHWLELAQSAMAERRWTDARQAYTAILNSTASLILKNHVRQQLQRIEKSEWPKQP